MAEENKKETENKKLNIKQNQNYLLGIIIVALIFALGFITSNGMKEEDVTIFTREDLERITELQELEDERNSGAEIFAYKDTNGNLMIGWDYNGKKRK